MKQDKTIDNKIYNILYKHSRVDGVRVLNEDEWPIEDQIYSSLEDACAKNRKSWKENMERFKKEQQREKEERKAKLKRELESL